MKKIKNSIYLYIYKINTHTHTHTHTNCIVVKFACIVVDCFSVFFCPAEKPAETKQYECR